MEHKSLTSLENQVLPFGSKDFKKGYHSVVERNSTNNKKRVHFVCTNEWFFKSHFIPLRETARSFNNLDTSLITKLDESVGTHTTFTIQKHFVNFFRSSIFSKGTVGTIKSLCQIFRRQQPDLIHLIGLRPIIFGGFSALFAKRSAVVYHLTGTGYLAVNKTLWSKLLFATCLRAIVLFLKRRNSHLIVENEEDLEALKSHGKVSVSKTTILGGAGIDPEKYQAQSSPNNSQLKIAYVGRMIWSKGVDLLVETAKNLECRNVDVQFDLYGQPDRGNLREIDENVLKYWNSRSNITWHGHTEDVVEVWAKSDIAVLPSRGGEGLPRALLEAAACCRPLIVTDVPGCRQFVRDGIEGLIVPPEDAKALAKGIEKLRNDPDLRKSMGQAARRRVLEFYTEDHVKRSVSALYTQLLGEKNPSTLDYLKSDQDVLNIAA